MCLRLGEHRRRVQCPTEESRENVQKTVTETGSFMEVERLLSLIHIYHSTQTLSGISHNMGQGQEVEWSLGCWGHCQEELVLLWFHISSVCVWSVRKVPAIRRVSLSQFKAYSSCWKTDTSQRPCPLQFPQHTIQFV